VVGGRLQRHVRPAAPTLSRTLRLSPFRGALLLRRHHKDSRVAKPANQIGLPATLPLFRFIVRQP